MHAIPSWYRTDWPRSTFRFFDSGTPSLPAIPAPTPPVTANNSASLEVQQAEYRQQLRRKSLNQTIYAGANPPAAGANPVGTNAAQTGAAPSASSGGGMTKTG